MWDLLTPEERGWKQTCRRFAGEVIAPHYRRFDRENRFPDEIAARAHDAGLMNVALPAALGGGGVGHRMLAVGGEELAAVCAPTAFAMGFNHGAVRPILHGGTDEQRHRFVGELIAKRQLASLCLTEPAGSGSNLTDIGTRAVRDEDGSWLVTGTKCMVGNGCDASLYVVLANAVVDGQSRGLTFFAIPRDERVRVGPNTDKLGFRCVTTPTIDFDGVRIDDTHRIGEVGDGEQTLLGTLDYIRLGGACVILGIVVGALRDVVPWLESRRAYMGEPLVNKSHVQLQLGALFARLRAARLMMWAAADRIDAGQPCSNETAAAKLLSSELAVDATNAVCQLYGWRGIDADYPAHKRLRDARATTIYEGTSEIQQLNLFRSLRDTLQTDQDI